MAIAANQDQPVKMVSDRGRVVAGVFSLALSVLWLVVLAAYVHTHDALPGWVLAACVIKAAIGLGLLAASVYLLRGRVWAQQVLLVVWLLALGNGIVFLISMMLQGPPEWWSTYFAWPMPAVLLPVVLLSAAAVVLLFAASLPRSRLRYASMVDASVVIALILAVVINLIAHSDPYRHDFETLGRYGLSERSERILADVEQDVTLTCIYTSREEGREADEYRPRVMELLEDIRDRMRREGQAVTVTNITSEAQRAELARRLRQRQSAEQDQHVAVVNEFLRRSEDLEAEFRRAGEQWTQMPDNAYLTRWGLTGDVSTLLKSGAETVSTAQRKVREALQGAGLPDYTALIAELEDDLQATRENLSRAIAAVDTVREIPQAVEGRRQGATDALSEANESVSRMSTRLGPNEAAEGDPAEILKAFARAAREAASKVRAASRALAELGGKDQSEVIRNSSYYSVPLQVGGFQVRSDLVDVLARDVARPLDALAQETEAVVQNAKEAFQKEHIERLREEVAAQARLLEQVRDLAFTAVEGLGDVDSASEAVFVQAERGELFSGMVEPMSALIEQMDELPEVEGRSLPSELAEDNIVLVEVGDEARVATFDDVWPRQMRQMYEGAAPAEAKRAFNGDSAIGSLILSMSHEPFARVLLVHYRPQVPPQMAQMMPRSSLPVEQLTTLRTALEEANFEVQEWNLAEARPEPEDTDADTPTVLLILPPPPELPFGQMGGGQVPSFGAEELAKIRQEIDGGTPAVFLAMYLPALQMPMYPGVPPMPVPQYELTAGYLRDQWGIDVKKDHRIIKGIPDQTVPGAYRIDVLDFSFLPVSTFSQTHPIGEPLQGQRVFWVDACPIFRTEEPAEGVEIDPLLRIPAGRTDYWAAADIAALVTAIRSQQEGLVRPDFAGGDMRPPMSLAVAATRAAGEGGDRSPARIVVLGVGRSMSDGYLDTPVVRLDAQGGIRMDDPPRANADLVINSVYWLTGHERLIASGPARVQPIRNVSASTELALRVICLGGLPLAVGVVGAVVLIFRRL